MYISGSDNTTHPDISFKFKDNAGVNIAPIIGIDIAKKDNNNILSFTFSPVFCYPAKMGGATEQFVMVSTSERI